MTRKVPTMNLDTFFQPIHQEWYKDISYEDTIDITRDNLQSAAKSFITIGYCLKHIKKNELYKEGGYQNIWECAQVEFGLSQTSASRYMSMNTAFSHEGNTPLLNEKYSGFNKSQLQEMLALSEDVKRDIRPEDTVPEIRKIAKEQKKQLKTKAHSEEPSNEEDQIAVQEDINPKNTTASTGELQHWLADLVANRMSRDEMLKGFIKHYILHDPVLFDSVQDDIATSDGAQVIASLKTFLKEYCE